MGKISNQTDQQLLTALKSGQPEAVRAWFARYQPRLSALIALKVSNAHDVEELVQETFLACLKHLPLFRGESNIWTWMQSVARHEVADYYRKKYAKKALQTIPLSDWLLDQPVADAHETAQKVSAALAELSKEYRELILLKYVDELRVKEIASKLNKSIKSVESDLFRARQAFKVAYADV